MIKIQHPKLFDIARTYANAVQSLVREKSGFFLVFLDVLLNGTDTINITNHPLHGNSKKPLVNKFLHGVELTNQNNYHLVSRAVIDPVFDGEINGIHAMVTYLDNITHLDEILLVKPEDAKALNTRLKAQFGITDANKAIYYKVLNEIIQYSFFDNFAYEIASTIGLSTCPYCNRNFIHTIIDDEQEEILRPTFDHFFSQVDHPFLSLSFFNLIPS